MLCSHLTHHVKTPYYLFNSFHWWIVSKSIILYPVILLFPLIGSSRKGNDLVTHNRSTFGYYHWKFLKIDVTWVFITLTTFYRSAVFTYPINKVQITGIVFQILITLLNSEKNKTKLSQLWLQINNKFRKIFSKKDQWLG